MKNYLQSEKDNKYYEKVHPWAILDLFSAYFKRNKAIILSLVVLPAVYIFIVSMTVKNATVTSDATTQGWPISIILSALTIQTAAVSTEVFFSFLVDMKQSILYKRIGLTKIMPLRFIVMASLVNFAMIFISHIIIFIGSVIVFIADGKGVVLGHSLGSIYLLYLIIFDIALILLFTSLMFFLSTITNKRSYQSICRVVVNLLAYIPLLAMLILMNMIYKSASSTSSSVGSLNTHLIIISVWLAIILISLGLVWANFKKFKWAD